MKIVLASVSLAALTVSVPALVLSMPSGNSTDRAALRDCASAVLQANWNTAKPSEVEFRGHRFHCIPGQVGANGDGSYEVAGWLARPVELGRVERMQFGFVVDYCTGAARPETVRVALERKAESSMAGTVAGMFRNGSGEVGSDGAADASWKNAAAGLIGFMGVEFRRFHPTGRSYEAECGDAPKRIASNEIRR